MSWLLGIISPNVSPIHINLLTSVHPTPLHKIQSDKFYLAAGGIEETCLSGSFIQVEDTSNSGWIVLGLGIKKQEFGCKFLDAKDWQAILHEEDPRLEELDGHFIIIKWFPEQIVCFTDQLGLRLLYIVKTDRGIFISTRLDWLARVSGNCEIDFRALSSHWLSLNQLSGESMVKGVTRLGPSGKAVCTPGSLTINHKPWKVSFEDCSEGSLEHILKSFLNSRDDTDNVRSLGLSGGFDSRVLLSLLALQPRSQYALHVFGHPDDPDVLNSKTIAREEHLEHTHLYDPVPSADECIMQMKEYVRQTCAIEPASSFLKLRYYPHLHKLKRVVVDGGMGEIARRQFFNRLLIFGRKALLNRDARGIASHITRNRARIFNESLVRQMRESIGDQIQKLFEDMPGIGLVGPENFLDLMVVRTRFPNWAAYEQSRMDGMVISYMPFAQPSFVRRAFATPVKLKRSGKIFRAIIRDNYPSLSRYPCVKSGTFYPYHSTQLSSAVWTKLKTKAGLTFRDPTPSQFLHKIAEFVQDILRSSLARHFEGYDYQSIITVVERFYGGEEELSEQVNWWLSFEMWREGIEGKS